MLESSASALNYSIVDGSVVALTVTGRLAVVGRGVEVAAAFPVPSGIMTFEDFKTRVSKTLVNAYGTRLAAGAIEPSFVHEVRRTAPLWSVHFVIDEEPYGATFAYGPPADLEEARFVTWLAELQSL